MTQLTRRSLPGLGTGHHADGERRDRLPEFYELTTGGVLLSIISLAVAMIVLQRFWRGGLTEGAVK